MERCPCCAASQTKAIYTSPPLPVAGTSLFRSAADALAVPMRQIDLAGCLGCGFAWNSSFDAQGLSYDQNYEGTQIHSPHFSAYLDRFAQQCLGYAPQANPSVLEVGCGEGEFLSALQRCGVADVVGYDPAYRGAASAVPKVYAQELPDVPDRSFDMVISRMTLEHIANPERFLRRMAQWLAPNGCLITQVPAGASLLALRGLSDLVYEHACFFSDWSLSEVICRATGLITRIETGFGGQHLTAISSIRAQSEERPADLPDFTATAAKLDAQPKVWSDALHRLARDHGAVWLWGAGSRAANVVSVVNDASVIAGVIDINERRTGCFLPGSRCETHLPSKLAGKDGVAIVMMNAAYREEIAACAAQYAKDFVLATLPESTI